jgi:hypothetical protein
MHSGQILLLHDSVMYRSREVADRLKAMPHFAGSIAVVHCLMNQLETVAVDKESEEINRVVSHLEKFGFRPILISQDSHDTIMAESQAPFAILHKLLTPKLRIYAKQGVLTPSGEALLRALEDRSAKWTPETFDSILSNPNLPQLIADMDAMIDEHVFTDK